MPTSDVSFVHLDRPSKKVSIVTETRETVMVLEELLENYEPAYGVSWEEWFHECENGVNRVRIETLIADLRVNGQREPIALMSADDEYAASVTNGMHRIAALRAIGFYSVIVEQDPVEKEDVNPCCGIRVLLGRINDDTLDNCMMMSSFRTKAHPDQPWVECSLGGSSSGYYDLVLDVDSDLERLDLSVFKNELKDRYSSIGTIDSVHVEIFCIGKD